MPDSLTIVPSASSAVKIRPRVLVASFGNGYEQRLGDGTNSTLRDWNLQWQGISLTVGGQLDALFTANKGTNKILWTQPAPYNAEGAKSFICEEWSLTYTGGLTCNFQATLLQRPAV